MDAGLNVIPVVFEATSAAVPGGFLTTITATHADPMVKVPSRTSFDAAFVVNQPGQSVYSRHFVDRTAIAVGEAAPYSIEVIEPKVPIVQNGSFNLRIVAKRAEGFKGAITVFPLWTPPGMGIQGSAVIPPEASECVLPMNAAPMPKLPVATLRAECNSASSAARRDSRDASRDESTCCADSTLALRPWIAAMVTPVALVPLITVSGPPSLKADLKS